MVLREQRPWTWAALGRWAASCALALALSAGLLLGPQMADQAWDQGVHVTPVQAAMHFALIAQGLMHHHDHSLPASQTRDAGPSLEAGGTMMSWGTPLTPAIQPDISPCLALFGCALPSAARMFPNSVNLSPATPPPKAA